MHATYYFWVSAGGPYVKDIQGWGDIEVVSLEARYELRNMDADFQHYAKERALDGVDVGNFTVQAEWGTDARSIVYAKAIGGDGPEEVFSAGWIFGQMQPISDEVHLVNFSLEPAEPMSNEDLLQKWGAKA